MSRSLIRKNQLHPDIADLISGYGNDFFITQEELNNALSSYNLSCLTGQNSVYITGNQTISGVKNFTSRPTFNGSGLATTGDLVVGTTVFDGNRRISSTGFNGLTPGGGDVVSFLNNVFYPFVPATISLNGYAVQESGTPFSNIPFVVSIIQNSETGISNLQFINNNVPFQTFGGTPNFGQNTYNTTLSLTANSTLAASVRINNNNNPLQITGAGQLVRFEPPHYFGSGVNNLQTNAANMKSVLIKQSIITKPSSRTLYATTNGYYYFVYPDYWGELSRISAISPPLDFNISTDFVSGNVTLTLANNSNYLYRFYKNTNQIILNNYGITYHF